MPKEKVASIRLVVPAASATPSPPIGPALGQRGLNIMDFCKQFNAKTQGMEKGTPIPVVITAFSDRSFTFIMKTPPTSHFIKKVIKDGAITKNQVREIAEVKMPDLNANDLDAACRMIIGSAKSMKVVVS